VVILTKEPEKTETTEEKKETPEEEPVEEEEISEEEAEKVGLPFPMAPIVRLMKKNMDSEKMIKKDVKIAMNKWLGHIVETVAKEMNKFPYVMMHIHEFEKATEKFRKMQEYEKEKERILAHLNAIKKDIERLERDLGKVEDDIMKID
jgi:glutaredoxin 2